MLDAAELIELAVFERHCIDLESRYQKRDTLYNDEVVVVNYFKTRISDLKEKLNDKTAA